MSAISSLYEINEKGWRSFDVNQLDKEQCSVVDGHCRNEATYERYKAIAISVGLIAGAAGIIMVTFTVAAVASSVLSTLLVQVGMANTGLILGSKVIAHLTTYTFGVHGLQRLWDRASNQIAHHWNYSKHLEQQALDALLQKTKIVKQDPPES